MQLKVTTVCSSFILGVAKPLQALLITESHDGVMTGLQQGRPSHFLPRRTPAFLVIMLAVSVTPCCALPVLWINAQ